MNRYKLKWNLTEPLIFISKNFITSLIYKLILANAQDPNPVCSDCVSLLNDLKSELQDKTVQEQVIVLVEQICSQLGTYQAICKAYVDSQLPSILNQLAGDIDGKTICTEIKLCNAAELAAYKPNILKDMMIKAFLKKAL